MTTSAPVLVYGNDLSALMAALRLVDLGVPLQLILPKPVNLCPQAGWTDGLSVSGPSPEELKNHVHDSLLKSMGLGDPAYLENMCAMAPEILQYLTRAGLPVERNVEGAVKRILGAEASVSRLLQSGLKTTQQILNILDSQILRFETSGHLVVHSGWDLVTPVISNDRQHLKGVIFKNHENQDFTILPCQSLIVSDVDGILISRLYQKGLALHNPEFLRIPKDALDHLRFFSMNASLGGLKTDSGHRTDVVGLYVSGEASASKHGADMPDGNRILENLYSGIKVAQTVHADLKRDHPVSGDRQLDFSREMNRLKQSQQQIQDMTGPENVWRMRDELFMALHEGCVSRRDHESLNQAMDVIHDLKERWPRIGLKDHAPFYNPEITRIQNLHDELVLAEVTILSILMRTESRGGHKRGDFDSTDDARFLKHTRVTCHERGPEISYDDMFEYKQKMPDPFQTRVSAEVA